MIPVVELLRVSTDTQAEGLNLQGQHSVNERTCAQYGLQVVATIELVLTGTEAAGSPQMAQVLELVSSGAVRGVVLAEYSRLFRPDRWSDLVVLQTFSDHAAQIYLPSGPIDLQSEIGFVQATVGNLLAALERRRIRERMHRGKEELRRRGLNAAGRICLPYGIAYSKQGGWAYTPDIERVRAMFRLFLSGVHNFEEIGRQVGISRTNVQFMLKNPVYAGWRVYDKKRDLTPAGKISKRDRKKIARAEHEVIRVRLPIAPVVTDEEFALVQQLIAKKAAAQAPRRFNNLNYLYRGYLYCSECGLLYYGQSGGFKKRELFYYLCKSHATHRRPKMMEAPCASPWLLTKHMDLNLDQAITEKLLDPGVLAPAIEAYNESRAARWRGIAPDTSAIGETVEELRRRRARVIESFIDGVIDREERDNRIRAIDGELHTLEAMTASASAAPPAVELQDVMALVSLFAEWQFLDRPAKRELIEAAGFRFYASDYEVKGVLLPGDDDAGSLVPAAGAARPARAA